jgi:SAM-dependent methyltransferase
MPIETIVNSDKDISSDAEDFYRKYWSETNVISEASILRKRLIIDKFFPSGLTGKKILEIGVGGEGGLILHLANGNEVHGLDVSDSAIKNCLGFGLAVTKANLDTDPIPFADAFFDVVFAFEVFEHFCNPQHALEEIHRVLIPGGIFISSIPSTYTYHWPRLFYPALFEREQYMEFLMVNGFRSTYVNDWFARNQYGRHDVTADVKSWSWYWHAEKLGPDDAQGFFEIGMHFWEKRDERGLRTRPIEAGDMFKKALEFAPDNTKIKLYSVHATIYRFLNNDPTQFPVMMDELFAKLTDPECEHRLDYLGRLLLMSLEANRLGFWFIEQDDYETLKSQLREVSGCSQILAEIESEERINSRLAPQ